MAWQTRGTYIETCHPPGAEFAPSTPRRSRIHAFEIAFVATAALSASDPSRTA